MAIVIERHITKHEIANKCLLLEDDKGTQTLEGKIAGQRVVVEAQGKQYHGHITDFYINGKFKAGVVFEVDDQHMDQKSFNFFFEQSVSEGKRLRWQYADGAQADGFPLLQAEITLRTR